MVIPDGFAQATLGFTGAAVPTGAAVTLGFERGDLGKSPAEYCDDFATAWETNINGAIVTTCVLSSVLVKFGPTDVGPSAEVGYSNAGNVATPAGAAAPAFLIHKNTLMGGRAGKGRMFVPGVPEASVDVGGVLQSGLATGLTTAFGEFLVDLATQGADPVLLHGPTSPITTPTPITSMTCDPVVGTQRRRQRR